MIAPLQTALTGFVPQVTPEIVLGLTACVLFLGSTFRPGRALWGAVALVGLAAAALALGGVLSSVETLEATRGRLEQAGSQKEGAEILENIQSIIYAAPVQWTRLAAFFKILALAGGALLVLIGWNDPDDEHAGEYHGCLLLIVAGTALVGSANDLITMFLALELVSIPTYILLYLARTDEPAQEAAMKYFLLSVFSSGLLLFGFSYLYGVTGTTNIPAITEALVRGRETVREVAAPELRPMVAGWQGLALVALMTVVAGLGFRITAVPFHFYAPDVYQGTTTPAAALLAFVPKVVGFAALFKLLGLVPSVLPLSLDAAGSMGEQLPVLLWIMAAVTMSLGNVLALLQDNIRRMLAYSSVAHAGYMLIGLAVAPRIGAGSGGASGQIGAVEAVLFYLLAYGAMTVGAFAVLHYLETPQKRVEKVDELAGLSATHPGLALLMLLFMLSLIGIPLTAGFAGKWMLFWEAMGLSGGEFNATADDLKQARLYRILALIAAVNAAVGGWYYLRVITVMYLREAVEPWPRRRPWPALTCIWACAAVTLVLGVAPMPMIKALKSTVPPQPTGKRAALPAPDRLADRAP